MNNPLETRLHSFIRELNVRGKGPLAVVLTLTRKIRGMDFPLSEQDFLTPGGGQVAGLSCESVQMILREHGIENVLAKEGGRTSRGSLGLMRAYIGFCNELKQTTLWNPGAVEAFWVGKIREYFNAAPLKLRLDASRSLGSIVSDLMDAALKRQQNHPGTMVAGAVLQHLVGAKLRVALPSMKIECHGFSVADSQRHRQGDFMIGDTAIHVTTAPTESLMQKCAENLAGGAHPLIITTHEGAGGAKALAKNLGIQNRVDVLDIQQFIATNVLEWT
jgi:hypothetical protein